MSGERPKLLNRKPSKEQVKKFLEQKLKETKTMSSSSTMASGSESSIPTPKEPFYRRYKFLWPMLFAVNIAVGAYLITRTVKRDDKEVNDVAKEVSEKTTTISVPKEASALGPAEEKPLPSQAIKEPVKLREPVPEKQQRELFKWMLNEKRKIKPQSPEEKKRIDDEKALLKQLIGAKSIPSI